MLVIPELEKEVKLLWELRDARKVLVDFIYTFFIFHTIMLSFLN